MGLSPNQILLGYEIRLAPSETPPTFNEAAQVRTETFNQKRRQAIDAINQSSKGKIPSQFQVGDQVWLEATNLKMKHQKTKLNPKHHGPFKIIKEISQVMYQLQLPPA